jgi:PAS domain-containing protein
MDVVSVLINVISPILVFVAFLGGWWLNRRKLPAEIESISTTAHTTALETLMAANETLRSDIDDLKVEIQSLKDANRVMSIENDALATTVAQLKRLVHNAVTQQRLQALINEVSDGVLIETPERQVAHVNQAFCDLFEIPTPTDELLGTDCKTSAWKLEHLIGDVPTFLQRVDNLIEDWRPVRHERVVLLNGNTLERSFIPLTHNDGSHEIAWIYRLAK